MKAWILFSLTVAVPVFLAAGPSMAAIEPVTSVQAGENGSPPYLLERITVGNYAVTAGSLATGTSIGETSSGSHISHADDLNLNNIASRLDEKTGWEITMIDGQETWTDTNGDNPDFFVFEAGINDDFLVAAVLGDGRLGQYRTVDVSAWGDTGLHRIGLYNWNQPIGGIAFAITDLLDQKGANLTNDSVIQGIQIISGTLDPALFAAVVPEPATAALLGLGVLLIRRCRRP
ncbi:MAG: PEP-CTERM sorting domain-containing protein [Sedimentisphaerales bacterium]|nr:PEP-CTERM sorting domain-containing protein [Sedimentisphaerales bacterium]